MSGAKHVRTKVIEYKLRLARERLPELLDLLDPCVLCPRRCMASRRHGDIGECRMGDRLVVSSVGLHHGEEFPISGFGGSGTVFLAGCNLHCVYCQNWTISQACEGRVTSSGELARAMIQLQEAGAHNINWVSPTHAVPMLISALLQAWEQGLDLPIVYNTGGYDSLEVLRLLDGLIDIYLPDIKYADAETGQRYSGIADYPSHNRTALAEMYRQVGPLVCDEEGIAVRGVLIRHLVLPASLSGTDASLSFLEQSLPGPVYVNIMDQYRPCFRAVEHPPLNRKPTPAELQRALDAARQRVSLRVVT